MYKYRLKFFKLNMAKYISHLDLLRLFTRAAGRASLPVKYSEGFNPHPSIVFLLPLPIGVTSTTEFVDIEFNEQIEPKNLITALNKSLPPDIQVTELSAPIRKARDINSASYEIFLTQQEGIDLEKINSFFSQAEIITVKKTKRGAKEINLKDYIDDLKVEKISPHKLKLTMILPAGGEENIKPNLVCETLEKFYFPQEFDSVDISRTAVYTKDGLFM